MRTCSKCGEPHPEEARFCPKCGAASVAAGPGPGHDPLVGKVIADRYLLVEKVGQGGSGTIYRGEHATLGKKVAVKLLHQQLSRDEAAIERFRREATTVGELDNDHILQVLDFGRAEDGRLFFAMEYLEGESLAKVLETTPLLPVERVLDVLTQVGEALMEAHGLGYVHRDLRPRNIFLTVRRGRADFVKLLDFGLAKLTLPDVETPHTALGMTFGDPRYMSPEQARGETTDRRSDIYSLGVIAYEMLTGGPPFQSGKTFAILQQHLEEPVPSLIGRRPDCPVWLDAVIQRALAKHPEERFLTVLKMLECLQARAAPAAVGAGEQEAPQDLSRNATQTAQLKSSDLRRLAELAAASPAQTAASPRAAAATTPAAQPRAEGSQSREAARPTLLVAPLPAPLPTQSTTPTAAPASAATVPGPTIAAERPRPEEQSGEWFDSGRFERAPGALLEDEDEYPPRRNRGPLIIVGVAGGLSLLVLIGLIVLPRFGPRAPAPGSADVPPPAVAAKAVPAGAPSAGAAAAPPAAAEPIDPEAPSPTEASTGAQAPDPAPDDPGGSPAARGGGAPPGEDRPSSTPRARPSSGSSRGEESTRVESPTSVGRAARPAAEPPPKEPKNQARPAAPPKEAETAAPPKAAAAEAAQADFFVKLGRQKLSAGDLAGAAAQFTRARELDLRNSDALAGLGEVAFEHGDYHGATVHLKQALRLAPSRIRHLVLLGQAFYKLGRPKDAIGAYRKALRLDPSNQEAKRSMELAERKLSQGG